MSARWPRVRLGKVLRPVSREEAVDPLREYPLLGVRLDGQGPFLRETRLGSSISARTLHRAQAGDFIYSRLFAWRGAFGVIPQSLDGAYVSNEFPLFQPVAGMVDVEFVRHWFRLPHVLDRVAADCTGSTPLTRNRYKEQFFRALEMPLPPLTEQRRIVVRIEELAGKLDEARTLSTAAAVQSQVLVTATHLSLSGDRTRRLSDVLKLDEQVVQVEPLAEYPQVGVRSFGKGLFPKAATRGTKTTYRTFNRLYDGALVLSQVKAWEGAIAVCDGHLSGWFVSPEYRTFRCRPSEARSGYLAALVKTEIGSGASSNRPRVGSAHGASAPARNSFSASKCRCHRLSSSVKQRRCSLGFSFAISSCPRSPPPSTPSSPPSSTAPSPARSDPAPSTAWPPSATPSRPTPSRRSSLG